MRHPCNTESFPSYRASDAKGLAIFRVKVTRAPETKESDRKGKSRIDESDVNVRQSAVTIPTECCIKGFVR